MTQLKRVFITGVSSGIGFATALAFSRAGWRVIGTARDAVKASRTADDAVDQGGLIDVRPLELRDAAAIKELARDVLSHGEIDVLVNNAGFAVYGPIDGADEAAIAAQYETNILAPIRLIREFAPGMRTRRTGAIVNVSSASGFMAQPFDGLYASSKHALEGLSESLHWEMKPFGVRVALIQLGRFDTPIREKIRFTDGFDPESVHWPAYQSWHAALQSRLWSDNNGESPSVAAGVILEAVTTPTPKLRWRVGPDVEAAAAMRSSGSFEEFEQAMSRLLGLAGTA